MGRITHIAVLRRWKVLSQAELASRAGVSTRNLQRWERNPALLGRVAEDTLQRLAAALSPLPTGEAVTVDHLRGRAYIPGYVPPVLAELDSMIAAGQIERPTTNEEGVGNLARPASTAKPETLEWLSQHGAEASRLYHARADIAERKQA